MDSSTLPEFCSIINGFRGTSTTLLFVLAPETEGRIVKWVIKSAEFVDEITFIKMLRLYGGEDGYQCFVGNIALTFRVDLNLNYV
jgi:hypothetical protein